MSTQSAGVIILYDNSYECIEVLLISLKSKFSKVCFEIVFGLLSSKFLCLSVCLCCPFPED